MQCFKINFGLTIFCFSMFQKRKYDDSESDSGSDYRPRRSRRERKVIYDDDFVIDGSGSEEIEPKSKGKNEDSWEDDASESEEYYGSEDDRKKRRKKATSSNKAKAKPRKKPQVKKKKKRVLDSDDEEESEDEDFETKDRKKRHMSKGEVTRQTRGVALRFDDEEEGYSDDDI